MLQEPCLLRHFAFSFSLSLSLCPGCKGLGLAWVAAKLQLRKNKFSGSKKLCFLHCSYDMKLREAGLCKKTYFFQALENCFFRTALVKLREARLFKKAIFQALKKCFFPHCSCETQTSPAFQKKHIFSGSIIFPRYSLKLRKARLCKKKSGSIWPYFFFACLLSNLPTPPRYLV